MKEIRTDLAIENFEASYNDEIIINDAEGLNVEHVFLDNNKAKQFKKKPGNYYTITTDSLIDDDSKEKSKASRALCKILKVLYKKMNFTKNKKALVVGLGNDEITPDSLGPGVIKKLFVTKHLHDLDELDEGLGIVSAFAPGVMGQTGIETKEIIEAICDKIKPDLVIVIDALAASSLKRVNRTIQITDSGITPGSGVGNKRKEISEDTLGCKVIAIGVPTVCDCATIYYDAINELGKEEEINIRDVLEDKDINYMVTSKEIDNVITGLSDILGKGLNLSLHNLDIYD